MDIDFFGDEEEHEIIEGAEELESQVDHHLKCYYLGNMEVTDEVFDVMVNQLKELNQDSEVLKRLDHMSGKEEKITHKYYMPSIDKVYSNEEVFGRLNDTDVLCGMYKSDGHSVSVEYDEHGDINTGATRGNGDVGESRTRFFNYIDIPKKFHKYDGRVTVVGEFVITKDNLILLNEELVSLGLEPMKNRRSAINILKREEIKYARLSGYIDFVAHNFYIDNEINIAPDHDVKLDILSGIGFKVTNHELVTRDNLERFVERYEKSKDTYSYLTDGMVFTKNDGCYCNDPDDRTGKYINYSIARKFETEKAETTIESIDYTVGRTGRITPVGNITPTELCDTTNSRCTLHNCGMIKLHNLKVGTKIIITKGGEIIPKFLSVKSNTEGVSEIPDVCPICGTKLSWNDNMVHLNCDNEDCSGRITRKIKNYFSVIGVKNVRMEIIDHLNDIGLVSEIVDVYTFDRSLLDKMNMFGNTTISNYFIELSKIKDISEQKFIESLGIKLIGDGAANDIISEHGSIKSFFEFYTDEKISEILNDDKIGIIKKKIASSVKYISKQYDELSEYINIDKTLEFEGKFSGKSFLLSGNFSVKKAVLNKRIVELGGKLEKSVNKNLDILVTNETRGKYDAAKKKNKVIWSEEKLESEMK